MRELPITRASQHRWGLGHISLGLVPLLKKSKLEGVRHPCRVWWTLRERFIIMSAVLWTAGAFAVAAGPTLWVTPAKHIEVRADGASRWTELLIHNPTVDPQLVDIYFVAGFAPGRVVFFNRVVGPGETLWVTSNDAGPLPPTRLGALEVRGAFIGAVYILSGTPYLQIIGSIRDRRGVLYSARVEKLR